MYHIIHNIINMIYLKYYNKRLIFLKGNIKLLQFLSK